MIELRPGDIFCSSNPQGLGKAIRIVQIIWRPDSEGRYGHAGIVTDAAGTTFEALWTIRSRSLFRDLAGERVLIGRHDAMSQRLFQATWPQMTKYRGKKYPAYRLPLFMLPPLAKLHIFRPGVCSELTALFLYQAGLMSYWSGVMPDGIADMIRRWRGWQTIFEGRMPE
jgi:hypothetical protein